MSSKHTPTPWRARVDARGLWRIGPVRIVSNRYDDPAVRKADALLVERAVNTHEELLTALKAVDAGLQGVVVGPEGRAWQHTMLALRVRAAIARAEGGGK